MTQREAALEEESRHEAELVLVAIPATDAAADDVPGVPGAERTLEPPEDALDLAGEAADMASSPLEKAEMERAFAEFVARMEREQPD